MNPQAPLILFWMKCGCVRIDEELDKSRNAYVCPCELAGRIDFRTTECKVCGERFEFKKAGATPVYCPACKEKLGVRQRPSEKDMPIYSDPFAAGHPNAIASYERENCIYRSGCLDEYWNKPNKQFLPCLGCTRYVPRKDKA